MTMRQRVVVITGAAKGIGRYVSRSFAEEGASLVLADVDPLDTVTTEVRALGADPLLVNTDVRDEAQVRWPRIRDMEKSFWDRVIDTNLGGTFLCTKHVLPVMEAQRSGHIINLSNPGGRGDSLGACAYGVSKVAIGTFTRYMAEEEREFGICVVGMTPGAPIATEEAPAEARARMTTVDFVGKSFVLAAQAGMELSGSQLRSNDGRLEVVP